mmetsp:Transcript_32003/g.39254  ORF Transcript_32003/g.39254 Transcript_32003/m.39254 type:complete len:260 (-) Transcript_32003:119-898(-)|eukprot:CAMPEP_0172510526 /NCGR_PEP_ID=MMETSP1066-20121228/229113_1 /TAXON_ID=671091 /ORGANISM="Coscinodiscus wailesii, Strain CCMP2513" /LENGTH=259 /DNA_ID=CAMNT_0013289511 /DNA_START=131 /DNA_END=910 /DNA_ORIENTATION=+
MTIVASEDNRNAGWAKDKSAFGHKMLSKMGWTEGKGLGKNEQGIKNNLRGVRRSDENLGIGAKTDKHGFDGWEESRGNYQSVLSKLQNAATANASSSSKKDKKKKKKKNSSSGQYLTLAQNKVTAGHAKKMRDAKDLSSKSREEMAAVFGVKTDSYGDDRHIVSDGSDGLVNEDSGEERKQEKKKKSRRDLPIDSIPTNESDISKSDSKKRKKRKRQEIDRNENVGDEGLSDCEKIKKKKLKKEKKKKDKKKKDKKKDK